MRGGSALVALAAAVAAALAVPVGLSAGPRAAETGIAEGARKIDLAGRQRMLTQRMAMAGCYASIGLEPARHVEMMRAAHDLFDATLGALRNGDFRLGLVAETDDRVLAGLAEVGRLWADYGQAVRDASGHGTGTETQIAAIAALNLPVLREMDRTVGLIERAHAGRGLDFASAITLNIAGRQRMLSQKMAKELCLVARGIAPEENRAALAGTIELFDASLAALLDGAPDLGIRPPQDETLRATLAEVSELWGRLAPLYRQVAAGGVAGPTQLVTVAVENGALLEALDRAVSQYLKG